MLPAPVDAAELAARIRAARGYSGLTAEKLAPMLNMSVTTLSRTERGRRTPEPREIEEVARICGVPMDFMDRGFDAIAEADDLLQRVSRLEQDVEDAKARAAVHAAEVSEQFARMRQTINRLQAQQQQ